jgi:hypothetical protein
MATTYKAIASQVLSSSTASVTFSSIPSTYTDLVLKVSSRTDVASVSSSFYIYYNSTSVSSGSYTFIQGNGASAVSGRDSAQTWAYLAGTGGSSVTANTFAASEFYIPNYASAVAHQAVGFDATENNATTGYLRFAASLFGASTAITSLIIAANSANFVSGSRFDLYGITHF